MKTKGNGKIRAEINKLKKKINSVQVGLDNPLFHPPKQDMARNKEGRN